MTPIGSVRGGKSKGPTKVYLPDIVGKGYAKFWNTQKRYVVVKGSRGSKKSKTAALWLIYMLEKYPLAHALVIRQVWNTHKDSTFADLQWAARRLRVAHRWKFPKSEVKITNIVTGQQILFRGCDDPLSITSISVPFGGICFVWIEEAYQVQSEETFDLIDESIRGGFISEDGVEVGFPPGYFRRIMLTFNPWSPRIWIKERFYRDPNNEDFYEDDNILAMTTTYKCNEWLLEEDRERMEEMKTRNPRRYRVAGEGHWGVTEGLIYENWEEMEFDPRPMMAARDGNGRLRYKKRYGMDFGFSTAPTAAIAILVDDRNHDIYIYYEHYVHGETNMGLVTALEADGLATKPWVADSAEPKTIAELFDGLYDATGQRHRLNQIRGSKKGKGSISAGIQKIQDYHIYVRPQCQNVISELCNYAWAEDPKTGKPTDKPIDDFNHAMDAIRYACEDVGADSFSFH